MKKIVLFFLSWKVLIYLILAFSLAYVPLQFDYLGGGLENYLNNPFVWSFLNFDGVHYLEIALNGYRPLTYFYFPSFPLIVRFISNAITSGGLLSTAKLGVWVSNLSFLTALFGIYKLVKLDFSKKISLWTIALLLVFPTSYYFVSFYNESLFLALVVWCFYFARKKKWVLTAILGAFSTATRVVGIAIIPALMVEVYLQYKDKKSFKNIVNPVFFVLLTGLGVLSYLYYLYIKTGDPLIFIH
ncbi:hypothetical protein ACFL25_00970, partial [Patescibacteria group bacterium]